MSRRLATKVREILDSVGIESTPTLGGDSKSGTLFLEDPTELKRAQKRLRRASVHAKSLGSL